MNLIRGRSEITSRFSGGGVVEEFVTFHTKIFFLRKIFDKGIRKSDEKK